MSAREIMSLGCRLIALNTAIMAVLVLLSVPDWYHKHREVAAQVGPTWIILVGVAPAIARLAVGIVLWYAADGLATRFFTHDTGTEREHRPGAAGFLSVGIAALGAILVTTTVPALMRFAASVTTVLVQMKAPPEDFNPTAYSAQIEAASIVYVLTLVIAVFLLLNLRRVAGWVKIRDN